MEFAESASLVEAGVGDPIRRAVLTDSDRFPFSPSDISRLDASGIELVSIPGHDSSAIVEAVQSADAVFIYSAALTKDVLGKFGRCRLIIRCGTGYDLIDVSAARALGIGLAYVPSYGEWDVAEHALALMFAVARRVSSLDLAVHRGRWPSYVDIGSMHRLHGAALGLLGFGRIARRLAEIAGAMGLVVHACDPYLMQGEIERAGAVRCTIDELARSADVISLHLPLTKDSAEIIDDAFLERVRPRAILINTARGELIDEMALARALSEGRLAGAGLDVLADEPPSDNHPLLNAPNTVMTPHTAALTDEALESLRGQAIDELLRAAAGLDLKNPIPTPQILGGAITDAC